MTPGTDSRLRAHALLAWRSPGRLQVGVGNDAVVLEGLSSGDELVVDALDAGTDDITALREIAARHGSRERADALLEALAAAGALATAEPPDRRRGACVVVAGASATGLAVALGLAAGGVGSVVVEDDAPLTAADIGPGAHPATGLGGTRGRSAALEVARRHPATVARAAQGRLRPDVVVLVASGAHEARRSEALVREGVTHLGVVLQGAAAAVGPLVRPGESSCLRCMDLHRTDRDPEWPRLLPQLAAPPGGPRRPEPPELAALAAALAVQQVLTHLDGGDPATLDATVEVGSGAVGVRPWSPHARCGCTWAAQA